ncbi:MAG: hypothetical protein ACKVPX_08900 [Myxococcaceae bacterium]
MPHTSRTSWLFVVVLSLAVVSGTARAQVNAEVLRPRAFHAGWSGGVDGSFALSRGNIELLDVGGGGRVQYQTLHPVAQIDPATPAPVPYVAQRVFVTASARFAENANAAFVNQAFVHARWTGMWHRCGQRSLRDGGLKTRRRLR